MSEANNDPAIPVLFDPAIEHVGGLGTHKRSRRENLPAFRIVAGNRGFRLLLQAGFFKVLVQELFQLLGSRSSREIRGNG
jgi:hypothetical protein